MNAILIVDEKIGICRVLRDFFQSGQAVLVQCAHTGSEAARMLQQDHYNIALIGLPLPESLGFDLVALAAERNTTVLLMTGHPVLQLTMRQFGFPYVAKPFTLDALRLAVERVMMDHAEQPARLKRSLETLAASRDAVAKAMEESDRLLDADRARQQLDHWHAAVARLSTPSSDHEEQDQ